MCNHEKNKDYDVYTFKGKNDQRFYPIIQILSDYFKPGQLIDWFMDDTKLSKTNEYVSMRKQKGVIALYDISAYFSDENYMYINEMLFPEKCSEMTVENFKEILFAWEKLRVIRPDIILIVIHEDNHVSLETDPVIIQKYQDAGYAFDKA